MVNGDDRSRGVDTRLVWSWRPNVDLTLGLQVFGGSANSEYGRVPGTVLVQVQWFL